MPPSVSELTKALHAVEAACADALTTEHVVDLALQVVLLEPHSPPPELERRLRPALLKLDPATDLPIAPTINVLQVLLSGIANMRRHRLLQPGTRRQTVNQLKRLMGALDDLDDALASFSISAEEAAKEAATRLAVSWHSPITIRLLLNEHFPRLRQVLQDAVDQLERNGPGRPERGRRSDESIARLVLFLAGVYYDFKGELPTIRTNQATNKAYSPFHDFVKETLSLVDIEGSAEGRGKTAATHFNDLIDLLRSNKLLVRN
jgi:hypothetical protein